METAKNKQTKNFGLTFNKFSLILLIACVLIPNMAVFGQSDGNDNACVECHKRTVQKDILHGPTATSCTSCHESNGKKHPLADVVGFTLFAEGAELCYSCHTVFKEEQNLKFVHKPVKNGECSECHEVHSSNNKNLVFAKSPDLCFFCHSNFDKDREKAKSIHTASYAGDACTQCHKPHASAEKKLLADNSKQLCLNCHNKKIEKKDGAIIANIEKHLTESSYMHKALSSSCTSCHNPHYSSRNLLLTDNLPIGIYAKGVEENFALCFGCHDTDLLNLEKTDSYTQFREADQNLHFLHVNKEKGRNCTSCHDVHAANNTKLIAKTVKFGRWDMPLNFIENENGGTCATGCHKERSYSRGAVK
ncbi:MAG: cytochrome c3 family protein [Lutibacter sp.]